MDQKGDRPGPSPKREKVRLLITGPSCGVERLEGDKFNRVVVAAMDHVVLIPHQLECCIDLSRSFLDSVPGARQIASHISLNAKTLMLDILWANIAAGKKMAESFCL